MKKTIALLLASLLISTSAFAMGWLPGNWTECERLKDDNRRDLLAIQKREATTTCDQMCIDYNNQVRKIIKDREARMVVLGCK